ncbi:MAG: class I SAM-dependent methyltransferase [Pseudomonadota bacterium]
MSGHSVGRSYQVQSAAEAEAAYDDWARNYEPDLCSAGYRLPGHLATVFARFVPLDAAPILDAGCGGGHQTEALVLAGYGSFTGIDFSEGMLAVARDKELYDHLQRMVLGETLDFRDDAFASVLSCGCITPGHAPPNSFAELVRVCRPGGLIVFSLRDDPAQDSAYPQAVETLRTNGAWSPVYSTPSFHSLPYSEPEITHQVHVFRVT